MNPETEKRENNFKNFLRAKKGGGFCEQEF
jgi:hypothetical protein